MTVASHVMRTCCRGMLKFRCVHNKPAGSLDVIVGSAGDRRRCRSLWR